MMALVQCTFRPSDYLHIIFFLELYDFVYKLNRKANNFLHFS